MSRDSGDRPVREIEITSEMIEAGANALAGVVAGNVSCWDADELAAEVFRAMHGARKIKRRSRSNRNRVKPALYHDKT